ncbi:MAG TPA: hypothetical protein VLJ15_06650 [Gammaproteobacteria bacterium]|nr:hypothetical protein [Gammaproteobacteria bacterium]
MRKITLSLLALSISLNVNAATSSDLGNAISKSIQNQSRSGQHSAIVYGGKDIARSIVATADQSTWIKQQIVIG